MAAPPLIRDIAKHPVLSKVHLIAEPWDLGMYQVGGTGGGGGMCGLRKGGGHGAEGGGGVSCHRVFCHAEGSCSTWLLRCTCVASRDSTTSIMRTVRGLFCVGAGCFHIGWCSTFSSPGCNPRFLACPTLTLLLRSAPMVHCATL
jgi:hypothetical protein